MDSQETFGPVVAITPFDGSEAAAVELSNDTGAGNSWKWLGWVYGWRYLDGAWIIACLRKSRSPAKFFLLLLLFLLRLVPFFPIS